MTVLLKPHFGTPAQRARSSLADSLVEIAEYIRTAEILHEPHGFVLLLHSDTNPGGFEVLNKGIRTKDDMDAAVRAMRLHIELT